MKRKLITSALVGIMVLHTSLGIAAEQDELYLFDIDEYESDIEESNNLLDDIIDEDTLLVSVNEDAENDILLDGWDENISLEENFMIEESYETEADFEDAVVLFETEPLIEAASDEPNIPSDAVCFNGHYYYIYSAASYGAANSYCIYLGGHLATISSAEENEFLFQYMQSKGIQSAYFGFCDDENEGEWKWVTGEPVTYTNWASGEPNGENASEDYAMFYKKYTSGQWNDGVFFVNDYYFCEWEDDPVDEVVNRYTIGKDTWSFGNYISEVKYQDFAKFFTPTTASILCKSFKNLGNCNGMCQMITSILDYGFPENLTGKNIHAYEKTGEIMQWIRYAQISQLLPDLQEEEVMNNNDYNGLYRAIKDSFSGDGEPVLLAIQGNHEVLPVSILKDSAEEVRLNIYDCNYPDNTDPDTGEPRFITLILNGNNGNYTSCKYYLSEELGGYDPIGEIVLNDLSYSVLTQCFIDGYLAKNKADLCSYAGATLNSKFYKLLHVKNNSVSSFEGITEFYSIHVKDGEDMDSPLYWVKDEDDQITINNVEAGETVTLALPDNSISITINEKADINLMVNNESTHLEVLMDDNGEVEVSSFSGNDEITGITSKLTGENSISVDIRNGKFITCGVSEIELEKTIGEYNESGELNGSSVYFSTNNIETVDNYTIDLAKISDKTPDSNDAPINTNPTTTQVTIPSAPTEKITISKKPTIKKPSVVKNKITVKWKHFKQTKKTKPIWKKIKKVQVQCATDKAFTNIVKTASVGKKKTKAVIKGLQKNTTYFVRIRYFDGTGYSKWSGVKKVKTKK